MNAQTINITFDSKIKHVLVYDGILKKSILKEYYPDGATLTYKENDKFFLLDSDNDNIFIKPNVNDYYIEFRTDIFQQEVSSSCSQADMVKKAKINEYLLKIQNKKVEPKSKQQLSKINDLRAAKSNPSMSHFQSKSVYIGWKHRYHKNAKYKHQKGSVGGSKEFLLDASFPYSVQDILEMSVKVFDNPVAVKMLQTADLKLGFFNGVAIEEFTLPDNTPCGIWDYYKVNLPTASRINVHILSTVKDIPYENSDEENVLTAKRLYGVQGTLDLEKSPLKQPLENVTNTFENVTKKFDGVEKSSDCKKSSTELIVSDTLENIQKSSVTEDVDVPFIDNSKGLTILPDSISQHSAEEKSDVINDQKSLPYLEEVPVKIIKHNYNKIEILYLLISTSKYSNEISISERDLKDLYFNVISYEDQIVFGDENNFIPVDNGFPISSIWKNKNQIFQLIMTENLECQYLYPILADISADRDHTIIYDIDEMIGYYNENFSFGVLPKCKNSCHSIISWFQDGVLFKKGEMLIWMNSVSIGHKWHCEIECSTGIKMKSKTIVISKEQELCFKFNPLEVVEVNKNDFKLSEKIGKGQQGIVYKGSFNNEEVAIKVIKVYSRKTERIEREIKTLKSVKHENFIKLFAVCKELKKISLITSYFLSEKLSDFIFDDDIKEKFGGLNDSKKNFISLQICRAITYLHNRTEPIIHCDIKPDNILINEIMVIKICNFGLSKFITELTVLNSNTVGAAGLVWTLSYIAPEILIDKQSASTATDVWSTACTLVEVYNEELIWDTDEEELKGKLIRKELPDLSKIPDIIKPQLVECFSYNPKERPDLVNIYNILDN